MHVVRGVAQLHRDGKIQPRRPTADARDFHAGASDGERGSSLSSLLSARACTRASTRVSRQTGSKVCRDCWKRITATWHSSAPVGQTECLQWVENRHKSWFTSEACLDP